MLYKIFPTTYHFKSIQFFSLLVIFSDLFYGPKKKKIEYFLRPNPKTTEKNINVSIVHHHYDYHHEYY